MTVSETVFPKKFLPLLFMKLHKLRPPMVLLRAAYHITDSNHLKKLDSPN